MSNAHTFRSYARIEEQMIRAAMPRTSAADPVPTFISERSKPRWSNGVKYVPPTYTLSEVANA